MPTGRRGRFTVRALMVATALVALATWGYVLWGRSKEYARKDLEYRFEVAECFIGIYRLTRPPKLEWGEKKLEHYLNKRDRAERLHRKYRRASMFPWLTPEVDPPALGPPPR